jgi:hypothetical protein
MAEKYSDRVFSIARENPVITGLLATAVLAVAWYLQTNPRKLCNADTIVGPLMISHLGKPSGQEEPLQHGRMYPSIFP